MKQLTESQKEKEIKKLKELCRKIGCRTTSEMCRNAPFQCQKLAAAVYEETKDKDE